MIHVILMAPEHPGNIGACARVMKNFGFRSLVLIEPKTRITEETRCRAKHAQDIVRNIQVRGLSYLRGFDILVGTTAKVGTDYNIPRSPISPRELAGKLADRGRIGILIGREGTGLSNDELRMCDLTVSIPASPAYPVLNISHALGIILYELFQGSRSSIDHIERASAKDIRVLKGYISDVLDSLRFSTHDKRRTQEVVWDRFIGKAMLTKREVFALIGFFKKLT